MPLRFRARPSVGPLRFNFTERGLRSVSIKVGPFTLNPFRGVLTTNLPGTGLYHEADLRPTACRCGDPALAHSGVGHRQTACTRCTCTRYRRAR